MSIFKGNIACIKKYNPILADKLENHNFSHDTTFELITAESGDHNIVYKGKLIHDSKDPQQEAMSIFEQLKDTSETSVSIIIGLGLGYLFKRLYLSSKGKIIIYEPNLDILRFTLEIVDFSLELDEIEPGKPRVYIANSSVELLKFLQESYSYKACLNICGLSSINVLYPEEIKKLNAELPEICAQLEANFVTLFACSHGWATYGILNLPHFVQNYNVNALKNTFQDKPAVIVSPGPSLDKNLEHLKQYRDRVILFCVGNAYKKLSKYGIKPDFLVFIDMAPTMAQVKDLDTSDTNIIVQSITNTGFLNLPAKKKFIFYSNNDLIARWISEIANFDIKDYENKGTVSYCALYSAFMMGCNPIVLIGQDLAYTDGKCYSSDSAYGALSLVLDETGKYKIEIADLEEFKNHYINSGFESQEEEVIKIKLDKLNAGIATIPGQNGEMLPTDSNYAGFIKFFEQFAYNQASPHPNLELINSSIGGAQIDGFKNLELQEALNNMQPLNLDINHLINEALSNYKEPVREHIDDIKRHMKNMVDDIERYIPIAEQGLSNSRQLLQELKKANLNINAIKALSNKLIQHYLEGKDLFNKHIILTYCVFKDLLELSRIMEAENSGANGLEDLTNIAQASNSFYKTFLEIIPMFKDTLNNRLSIDYGSLV